MASDMGMPARLRSFFSSFENARHSGPVSSILSFTTNPQKPHTISPLAGSTTMGPLPHLGHLSPAAPLSLPDVSFLKLINYTFARYRLQNYLYHTYLSFATNSFVLSIFTKPVR